MAEKLRPFRWLGSSGPNADGFRSGVLHIDYANPQAAPGQINSRIRRVIFVGEVVSKPEELAALGAERIAELVRYENAEYLDVLDRLGVEQLLNHPVAKDDSTPFERERAQEAANDAAINQTLADGLRKNLEDPEFAKNYARAALAMGGGNDGLPLTAQRVESGTPAPTAQSQPAPEQVGQPPAPPVPPFGGPQAHAESGRRR